MAVIFELVYNTPENANEQYVLTLNLMMVKGNEKTLLISFSGGRTSAYMTYQILSGSLKEQYAQRYQSIIPVFLNTSAEHTDTYRFIEDCVRFFGWENFICLQVRPNIDRKKIVMK